MACWFQHRQKKTKNRPSLLCVIVLRQACSDFDPPHLDLHGHKPGHTDVNARLRNTSFGLNAFCSDHDLRLGYSCCGKYFRTWGNTYLNDVSLDRGSQKRKGLAVLYENRLLSFPIPMQQYTGNYLIC